jgi:hypothetical protein
MSKTTIIIATITNKEEQTRGEFTTVKITLENGLQKDIVECHPSKAEKVNVGDFVEAICSSKYGEYKDNVWHKMQVGTIQEVKLTAIKEVANDHAQTGNISSDDIPF